MNVRVSQLAAGAALALVAALAAACMPQPDRVISPGLAPVPIVAVNEQQDEWLHDYCVPRKLVSASSLADADQQVRASAGNFGEVVYQTRSLQIVAYACPSRPMWTAPYR